MSDQAEAFRKLGEMVDSGQITRQDGRRALRGMDVEEKLIPLQPLGEMAEHWAKLGLISPRWVVFVKLLDIESPGL